MPEGEQQATIDTRLLEPRHDFRRTIPPDIDKGFRDLLIRETESETPERTVDHETGEIKEVPVKIVLRRELIGGEIEPGSTEETKLNKLEREVVKVVIRELIRPAVRSVGEQNVNIVPYEHYRTVEAAVLEINELRNVVTQMIGEGKSPRSERILRDIDAMKQWIDGNSGLIKGAGPMLDAFYDGWAAMAFAVKAKPRYDITATDLHNLYRAPGEIKDWALGAEVVKKQDNIYSVLRGIGAANRHAGRNMGEQVRGDYTPPSEEQLEFIEKIFGYNPPDEKGEQTDDVETISFVSRKSGAESKTSDIFGKEWRRDEALGLAVGRYEHVTEKLVDELRRYVDQDHAPNIWVNGVEWPLTEGTLEKLSWKVDSGDKILIARDKIEGVTVDNYQTKFTKVRDNEYVAILRKTPREIRNIFVMPQTPHELQDVKRKLAVLISSDIWERLGAHENPHALIREFNNKRQKYESSHGAYGVDIVDEHIIEAARIALLFYGEGAELGWGFNYKNEKVKVRPGSDNKITIPVRGMDMGSTKATTDMSTALFWLYTEANNNWRYWSQGMLPMSDRTRRQIIEHEPGWAPGLGRFPEIGNLEQKSEWFVGSDKDGFFVTDAPTKFTMSFLDTVTFVHMPGQEYREEISEVDKKVWVSKRAMRKINEGMKMSEIPWRHIIGEAPYRWYITMSQLAMGVALLSRLPDRETVEKFFGVDMTVATNAQLLELVKRSSLGLRDLPPGSKDVEKFIPLALSLYVGWSQNFFKNSPNPGEINTREVNESILNTSVVLEDVSVRGDSEGGKRMVRKFRTYMDMLKEIGRKTSTTMARRRIRARLGL